MTRDTVEVAAIAILYAFSLVGFVVWMTAFLAGGETVVTVDRFGEGFLEFVLWAVCIPVIAVGLHEFLDGD